MWYSSPAPCGIIQPRSSVQVPVVLAAQVTGEQCTAAELAVFGGEGAPLVSPSSHIPSVPMAHPAGKGRTWAGARFCHVLRAVCFSWK